jgi:hypothetical protein
LAIYSVFCFLIDTVNIVVLYTYKQKNNWPMCQRCFMISCADMQVAITLNCILPSLLQFHVYCPTWRLPIPICQFHE